MAGAPFLENVPSAALDRFAAEGAVHRFRRGTYLCHQGDPDGDVFFLVAGRVEINSRRRTATGCCTRRSTPRASWASCRRSARCRGPRAC